MIGRTLSHYKILEEIRRGGMGIVYRALDLDLDREVALKVLTPDVVVDPGRKRRFIQEAKAAAKLEHPHIGVVHEIGESDGITFIVMELIRGEMLRDVLDNERMPLARTLEIATEAAEGLARAHEEGIVHRDIKPSNIMLTNEGHAKVIDFGLAKLVAPVEREGSSLETLTRNGLVRRSLGEGGTDPGTVLGTVTYMSPEQARGQNIDHRSDVFSFGITLYEMLTGRVPFSGPSAMDTLQAVLSEPAPPLPSLGSDISNETAFEINHIVERCLAKGTADRYQTMKDLVVDLRSVRRRLESGSTSAVSQTTPSASSWVKDWKLTGAVVTSLLLAVVLVVLLKDNFSPTEVAEVDFKPTMAVLYFENTTGDPSLDWLRTGLTDMLVTDLSQSPNLEVLSTDRLYHILNEMNRLDDRITSLEAVQEVADKAGVGTVVLGSFQKAGDSIRINIRVQEASSGKILTSAKVEGEGESSIFPMVDELTRRIKSDFDIPPAAVGGLEQDLKDVTTSSVEAYRYYAEGIHLHEQGKEEESIPLFEKAIEIDPGFAMALAKLAVIHGNLRHPAENKEYADRALENLDRLTVRERYYVEGASYSRDIRTAERSIEAYRKAVELYNDHNSARNNLAVSLLNFGRYEEAAGHYEELRRRNMMFPGTHSGLAICYGSLGKFEKGLDVLEDYVRKHPQNAAGHRNLGEHLVSFGRIDEGLESFARAEELQPGQLDTEIGRFVAFSLSDQREQASAIANDLAASRDPYRKISALVLQANILLCQGKSQDVLELLEPRIAAFPPGRMTAILRYLTAATYLARGNPLKALEQSQTIGQEGKGSPVFEREGPCLKAKAAAELGRWEEAAEGQQELEHFADLVSSQAVASRIHLLDGELALIRGDTDLAIDKIHKAESLLSKRGLFSLAPQPHVGVWFPLASAYLTAGDEVQAAMYFERIVESTTERMWWPFPYVRSFYFLGKIYENRGEMEKARQYYGRFYDYWKAGDLDRERVAEAKSKIRLQ